MTDIFARIANVNNNKVHLTEEGVMCDLDKQETNQKAVKKLSEEMERWESFVSSGDQVTAGEMNTMQSQLGKYGINARSALSDHQKDRIDNYEHALYTSVKNADGSVNQEATAEATWVGDNKGAFEKLTKMMERKKEDLEGNDSKLNFKVQMATSDLTTAEQARAAAIKKRDEQRTDLQNKWAQ